MTLAIYRKTDQKRVRAGDTVFDADNRPFIVVDISQNFSPRCGGSFYVRRLGTTKGLKFVLPSSVGCFCSSYDGEYFNDHARS